ncbi:MAG TPA: hypothetical protein PLM09_02570 [Casimicrobiaceae bacterium]|nr:hypothetical protein [Casimicrobiaceae bacterium]
MTRKPHLDERRRRVVLAASAAPVASLLAACAGTPGARDGPPAPAPVYRAGDRWGYRVTDGFRNPAVYDETREVVSVDARGITIRVSRNGPNGDTMRVEQWTSPGDLAVGAIFNDETRRFTPPLPRWQFPLTPGARWSLWAPQINETTRHEGPINYDARVGGWRSFTTPAGAFDAVGVRVFMRLDDEEFWRTATEVNHLLWWSPAVGNTVREERQAEYRDKGDPLSAFNHRTQNATFELTSYRRA